MVRENSAAAHEALKEVEELKKQLAEKPKEIEVTDYDAMFDLYLNVFNDAGTAGDGAGGRGWGCA